MKQLVQHTIKQFDMIPPGTRVLCGLSGGADSVSLLLCLQELGYDVCACHLNHGLRGADADADEAFCSALCKSHQIPFVSERCDANQAACNSKQSVETAARALRYDFFTRCAKKFHAHRIATAHTADDNLETMLFHLIRGTGTAGLSGIPPVRDNIIRPLIAVERQQLVWYLQEKGQDWRTDATNLDDSCTRNKIRHHVIPALKQIEPQAARHAVQAAALLRQDDTCLNALAQVKDAKIDVETLLTMPEAIASRAVRHLLTQADVPIGEIGQKHILAVMRLAKKTHGSVNLPGRKRAVLRNHCVIVEQIAAPMQQIPLIPEQPQQFGAYTVCVTEKPLDIHNSFKYYPIAYDTINTICLSVRQWKSSDRMTLPGMRGARSLKRLYTDYGISSELRDTLPVLCCGDTIIAAVGIGVDDKFYGNTGAFVFRLQADYGEETKK